MGDGLNVSVPTARELRSGSVGLRGKTGSGLVMARALSVLEVERFNDDDIWDVGPAFFFQAGRVGWEYISVYLRSGGMVEYSPDGWSTAGDAGRWIPSSKSKKP